MYDLGPRGTPEGSSFESPSVRFELENFNVRTFYDKLEDQTLHVSSQLARHQADLRAFYDRISQQAEKLKGMLDSMDVSALIKATKDAGRAREGEVWSETSLNINFKGALSRIFNRFSNSQNLYLWRREPKNNGPFFINNCFIKLLKLLTSIFGFGLLGWKWIAAWKIKAKLSKLFQSVFKKSIFIA